jgi:squalene-associated FAD-dependent desaturase
MVDERAHRATLTSANAPAPWHLLIGLLRWPAIPVADRLSALKLARLLVQIRRTGAQAVGDSTDPSLTVSEWLAARGQSPKLCAWLWYPLAIAALNQAPETAAAAPFVRVLGELFAPDPLASAIGLPSVPLDDLYGGPSAAFIRARDGEVLAKSPATVILDSGGGIESVRSGEAVVETTRVICAVPWHAFGSIWNGAPPQVLAQIAANATAMKSSPIVTVNSWFDPPIAEAIGESFIGLVGGPMHWIFQKAAIFGGTAQHLSVVASGADDLARMDNEEITALAMAQIARALPGVGARQPIRSVVVREHRATFSLAPHGPARPDCATPLKGFFLAGDWTNTGLPGTIEGAVVSGHKAADAVISAEIP